MNLSFRKNKGEMIPSSLTSIASNMLTHGKSIYKHLCTDSTT